jgi:hypothetical protein
MNPATSAYDAVALRDGIAALGLPVVIDHSPVWGSPHKHVYAFLSDRRWDGPLIHVSPQEELETGDGIYVTSRKNVDDTNAQADTVDGLDELLAWVEDRKGGQR